MNSKDKTFLEKFFVKESSILIDLENSRSFPSWAGLGGTCPINQKMTKSLPVGVPFTKYLHLSNKSLTLSLMLLEIEHE